MQFLSLGNTVLDIFFELTFLKTNTFMQGFLLKAKKTVVDRQPVKLLKVQKLSVAKNCRVCYQMKSENWSDT